MRQLLTATLAISLIAVVLAGVAVYLLYAQTSQIHELLSKENEKLNQLSTDVNSLKGGVSEFKGTIGNFSSALRLIEKRVSSLEEIIKGISPKIANINESLQRISSRFNRSLSSLKELIQESKYPITLTDALGRTVTIPHRPLRIVSTAPAITEILFSIGAGKQVVGVDQFSNYPPVIKELKKNGTIKVVGGFSTLSLEAILKLKPDLVVTTAGVQEKYAKELIDMGLTVYVVKTASVADVFDDILVLGTITGNQDKAYELVEEMSHMILNVRERVIKYLNETGEKPLKVYYEIYPDYWTVGRSSFINDLISLAGGENIFENVTRPYFVASPESIVKGNPTVIIVNYNYGQFGTPQKLVERIASRSGWSNITAVKKKHVYVISGVLEDIMDRPGPRLVIGVEALARIFYPKAFGLKEVPMALNETVLKEWGLPLTMG